MNAKAVGTLAILAVLAAVAGCGSAGPDLGTVQGTVTLDSKPLAGAMVVFRPEHGKESRGLTDAQGRYELTYLRQTKGALVGRHKVSISIDTELARTDPAARPIPPQYNLHTELTARVNSGSNTIDFAL